MGVLSETFEITVIGLSVVFLVLLLLTIILKIQGWLMTKFFSSSRKPADSINKNIVLAAEKDETVRHLLITAAVRAYLEENTINFQEGKKLQKYKITIEGKSYEVEVEKLSGDEAEVKSVQATSSMSKNKFSTLNKRSESKESSSNVQKKAAEIKNKAKQPVKSTSTAGGKTITAPMPGQIIKVAVAEGDKVAQGQQLAVLEAMKMENDITAPAAGTVASIAVEKGSDVNSGDILFVIN